MQARTIELLHARVTTARPALRLPRLPRPADSRNTTSIMSTEVSAAGFITGMVFAIAALALVWLVVAILAVAA